MSKIKGKYIEFNDAGTGTTDAWSADKIISYADSANPFDQSLNTDDSVTFKDLTLNDTDEYLKVNEIVYSSPEARELSGLKIQGGKELVSGAGTDIRDTGIVLQSMNSYNSLSGREVSNIYLLSIQNYSGDDKFIFSNNGILSLSSITASSSEIISNGSNPILISDSSSGNLFLSSGVDSITADPGATWNTHIGPVGNPLYYGSSTDFNISIGVLAKSINGTSNAVIIDDGNISSFRSNSLYIKDLIYGEFDNELLKINGDLQVDQRTLGKKGSYSEDDQDITLGDGNLFEISDSSYIYRINSTNWTAGSVVILQFNTSCDVYSSYTASGNYNGIRLAGTTTFSAVSGNTLTLVFDGTFWRETSRMVV